VRALTRWGLLAVFLVACAQTAQPPKHPTAPRATAGQQDGMASWYGEEQTTASGERFDKRKLTAAHRTLRMGTRVRITNKKNGRHVEVRINDRGPYGKGRIIDVSEAAARILDMIEAGVVPVRLEVLQ
jgi:rare lipoprotein A